MENNKIDQKPNEKEIKYILELLNEEKLTSAKELTKEKIKKYPKSSVLFNILGAILFKENQLDEAIQYYNQSIKIDPNHAQTYNNLGTAFHKMDKTNEAIINFKKAIHLKDNFIESLFNLANVMFELGNFQEASLYFEKVAKIKPDFKMVFIILGKTYMELAKIDKALDCMKIALKFNPSSAEIYNNLGLIYERLSEFDKSLLSFKKAIELNPNYEKAHNNLGNLFNILGQYDESNKAFIEAIKIRPDYSKAYSNLLFNFIYKNNYDPELYLREAKKFRKNCKSNVNQTNLKYKYEKKPEKLRLGLVSADFGNHPGGYFTLSTLKELSKKNFELIAYSSNDRNDEMSAQFRPLFLKWHSIERKKDKEVVEQIRKDGIHILIDMQGHTAKNRLPVFIYKPAPVQATWLGQGSTGIPEIDYFIGSPHITPKNEEKHYVEKIFRLPEISQCFTEPDFNIKINELPALKNKFVTFGSINKLSKLNEAVITLWSEILITVKNSKLILKTREFDDQKVVDSIFYKFDKKNIEKDRLILKGRSKNRKDSLKVYNEIDIGLDPFPFQGVTTTTESAWMGVPVITLKGNRYLAHFGESINSNLNMKEWIAQDNAEYVLKAKKFSSDLNNLSKIRINLRQNALKSPLFDSVRFSKNFSDMLWKMWKDYINK